MVKFLQEKNMKIQQAYTISLVFLLLISFISSSQQQIFAGESTQENPLQVEVFHSGEEGYHTYRIPAMIVSPKGTILAFCVK